MDTDRLKGKTQEFGGAVQRTVGEAIDDASLQGEGIVRQLTGKTQDLYGQAKDSFQDVAETAAGYAGDAYDRGDQYARRGASLARGQIEEYPLVAVLLAGAVGYLLAMVLHSRKS